MRRLKPRTLGKAKDVIVVIGLPPPTYTNAVLRVAGFEPAGWLAVAADGREIPHARSMGLGVVDRPWVPPWMLNIWQAVHRASPLTGSFIRQIASLPYAQHEQAARNVVSVFRLGGNPAVYELLAELKREHGALAL